jgi:hypothetical protein
MSKEDWFECPICGSTYETEEDAAECAEKDNLGVEK